MTNTEQLEQRSEEWFLERAGKVTASRIADVMARVKSGGYGASRANYMAELLVERLTEKPTERYTNAAMQWGTDTEPLARAAYEFQTENEVKEVGFVLHPTIKNAGASPDGTIGSDGLIEIKCPQTSAHLDFFLDGKIPQKYMLQMQFQMACTGRKWCGFVSFDPSLPANLQMKIVRVERDNALIAEIEDEVTKFLAELDDKEAQLRKQGG